MAKVKRRPRALTLTELEDYLARARETVQSSHQEVDGVVREPAALRELLAIAQLEHLVRAAKAWALHVGNFLA